MPDRREFLMGTVLSSATNHEAAGSDRGSSGLIPRESEPPNLETPASALLTPITNSNEFYIRNHFPTPKIDPQSWRLRVEGAVEKPIALTLDDLNKMTKSTRSLTMECAGNGRVFLVPKVRGVNWAIGAVGNAVWSGPTLDSILKQASVKSSAVDIVLEGADIGTVNDDPKSPGPIAYARSVPIAKARKPEVMLATHMNDQPLTPEHGWPLRAIVGGWYGMASVKWLTRIIVTETPYQGFWQTMDYSHFERVNGLPTLTPITAMRVKAVIASPEHRGIWSGGTIRGAAWAGEAAIAKVEVSTTGGSSWTEAKLMTAPKPYEWVHWEFVASAVKPGQYRLLARATDTVGRTQPMTRDGDLRTYQINHVIPVEVTVR